MSASRRLFGSASARLAFFLLAVAAITASTHLRTPRRTFTPGLEPGAWPTSDGVGGAHFSPLTDINRESIPFLEVAWTYRTGDVAKYAHGMAGTSFEATPILADGILFVSTPRNRAIALDPETGAELWTFDPGLDATDVSHHVTTSRGLAFWADPQRPKGTECASRIFLPVFDARLFALDAHTGRPCPDFAGGHGLDLGRGVARIEGRRDQYKLTAPPTVIGDVVVVGSSVFDGQSADAPSGVVRGFDARTGALRWAWEPLAGVGARGTDGRWVPAGAGNTWATNTADPERDLVFVPTGSPSPDHYGGLRPGDDGYANSLVALRASTGEVVWHAQLVHHDLWDYDLPSPPALITLERDGHEVPAVVQSTKMGYLFVFNRETGEPLFPIEERPVPASDVPGEVTSPTQPFPVLPEPLTPQHLDPEDAWGLTPLDRDACRRKIASMRNDGPFTPPSLRGTVVYPGFIGGMEWGGVAYDPASGLLVTNTNQLAMAATLIPRKVADRLGPTPRNAKYVVQPQEGTPYAVRREPVLSPLGIPCTPPPWGTLHAVDMRTGRIAWTVPLGTLTDLTRVPSPNAWGSPNLGGPLVTGDVVIIASTMDRRIRAFDLATGESVWSAKLPASAQATPMTYRVRPGGRQYLVICAGGHEGLHSSLGDYVIAFALPEPAGPEAER
ncbi:MAG: pyrroloquinoline quinone-dependent dehydrogenase [Gemmatimonadetes bacterium]|nr:pyrroloquinoline quinone-dependent dehydrogenase [Gemmatimonadota bacterium]